MVDFPQIFYFKVWNGPLLQRGKRGKYSWYSLDLSSLNLPTFVNGKKRKVKKTNGWYSSNIWIPFLSRLSWQASPLIMSFFPAMQKKQFWKINFVLFSILNWRWKTPAKETILENKYILSCFCFVLHLKFKIKHNSS